MAVRRAWRWAIRDFRQSLAAFDPSKLMIAPILFFGTLAVLDRAVYEVEQSIFPRTPERPTRLSAVDLPSPTLRAQQRSVKLL